MASGRSFWSETSLGKVLGKCKNRTKRRRANVLGVTVQACAWNKHLVHEDPSPITGDLGETCVTVECKSSALRDVR